MNTRQKHLNSPAITSAIDAFLKKTAPAAIEGQVTPNVVSTPPQVVVTAQHTEVLTITPTLAQEWLDTRRKDNCRHSNLKIRTYAGAIKEGTWRTTHQGIAFDFNGKIHDGYHRLHAIVKANLPVNMQVTWNVDPETYKVIDVGFTRTPGHMLRMAGSKHADIEAAGLRLFLRYQRAIRNDAMPADNAFSTEEITTYWENDENISDTSEVILSRNPAWKKILRSSVGLALALLAVEKRHPAELVAEFLHHVGSGANLGERDPILNLRNKVSAMKSRTRTKAGKLPVEEELVMTIRAYIAWVQKRPLKNIFGSTPPGGNDVSYPDMLRYLASQHRQVTLQD